MLRRQDELIGALTDIATHDSASDELHRSIQALAGARWELARNRPETLDLLGVFLPSNNILYSYTLMCLIPALYCRRIEIRPSSRVKGVIETVHEILAPVVRERGRGQLALTRASQRDFVRSCGEADGVIFTGRYENGLEIASRVSSRTRLLLFGSGPNPFVVGPEASADAAVHDLLRSRLYNSGQDCLCPDAMFVHRDRLSEVVTHLGERLAEIPIADRRDPEARVTPLVYDDAVQGAAAFLDRHRDLVRFGGTVDVAARTVAPSIVVADLHPGLRPPEFFSPVFLVCAYDDAAQITQWATAPEELARGMYMSVYGEPELQSPVIGTSIVCRDCTTFDIEDGNRPFGGYGAHASSVHEHGRLAARPLLVSAEFGTGRPGRALATAGTTAARESA
ncbi:aldehyde dehydrogenase family protein [Streptomyces guryensis]|uniref:Aldehyde dehydrogenase family protein n=1 Tax=Streptomyces guryensis TaxID=2886947 RepID=A0A9Q3ZBC6_9ACTN|nr:aldehyde dehydrogenase family protein [Streptomyces guryensis]MCD9880199.1 aldehyde dehydrogenase family protein [Streptomyces guryensis]